MEATPPTVGEVAGTPDEVIATERALRRRRVVDVTTWSDRRQWLVGGAFVSLTALWATRPFWWPGRYVVAFDGYTYSAPNLEIFEAAARRWSIALWNDSIFGGVTNLGNPSAATIYPFRLLTLLFGVNRSMGVIVALHVVLLGLGFVLLARSLRLHVVAATTGGCALVLSGMTLTKALQFEQIMVIAWMPWLVLAIRATMRGTWPWRPTAGLAVVVAATITAGHAQMTFELVFVATATVLACVDGTTWRRTVHVGMAGLLGALMAAPELIAVAVATKRSAISGGRTTAQLLDPQLSLVRRAVARALLGSISTENPAVFLGQFEGIAFVGVVAGALAVLGVVHGLTERTRRQWTAAFAILALFGLMWSTGPRTVIYRVARRLLPGFDLAWAASRWLVVVAFVALVLAAIGLDALLRRTVTRQSFAITAALLAVGAAALAATDAAPGETLVQWAAIALVVTGAIGLAVFGARSGWRTTGALLVAILLLLELGLMSFHSLPFFAESSTPLDSPTYRTATTDWLRGRPGYTLALTDDLRPPDYSLPGLRPNANVLVGIRSVDGYDGGVQITQRWADMLRRFNPAPNLDLPLRNNIPPPFDPLALARVGVHFLLLDRTVDARAFAPGWDGPAVQDDRFVVYVNPAWRGEAVAWPSAEAVPEEDVPRALGDAAAELRDTLLVTDPGDALACVRACGPVGLRVTHSTPEHATTVVDLDVPSIVALDQQFDDGWNVTVDGRPANSIEADGFVVAVHVPSGRHTVEWRYRPGWLTASLIVATLAWLATLALGVSPIGLQSVPRRRPPRVDPASQ